MSGPDGWVWYRDTATDGFGFGHPEVPEMYPDRFERIPASAVPPEIRREVAEKVSRANPKWFSDSEDAGEISLAELSRLTR